MTKAEKIFKDTYMECRIHIRNHGYMVNPNGKAAGFSGLITNEVTCARTWNAIEKLLEKERESQKMYKRLGIWDEHNDLCEQALNMVESTIENERESERKFRELLNA